MVPVFQTESLNTHLLFTWPSVRRIILDFAIRRMMLACTFSVHAPAQYL